MPSRINTASKQKYIQKLIDKFGDIYDYSLADYVSYKDKIKIKHKATQIVFEQPYNSHLLGLLPINNLDYNFIVFTEKCNLKFSNRFLYSSYKGYNKLLTIYDTVTKLTFEQVAQNHYESLQGLPKTHQELLSDFNVFKKKAVQIHGNIFEYLEYLWNDRKIVFKDIKSGRIFTQNLYDHLLGSLPSELSCKSLSRGEKRLREEVKALFPNSEILYNKRPKFLKGLELDIYIPSLNLAFEFNGTGYHHSNFNIADSYARSFAKSTTYHLDKLTTCLENNVKLIHIFDFEKYDLKSLVNLYLNCRICVVDNIPVYVNKRLKVLSNFSKKSTYIVYKPIVSFINTPS